MGWVSVPFKLVAAPISLPASKTFQDWYALLSGWRKSPISVLRRFNMPRVAS